MNKELLDYIETEIFPLYERNEKGHGIEHIKTVIRRSLNLAKDYDVNLDMVYTVAAYHDLGHFIDRNTHEIISAKMFMEDDIIKNWFTDEQRIVIKEAIEDHRASSDHKPRTIYGKIVSTADRTVKEPKVCIERALSYGLKHYEGISVEENIQRAYEHLTEKFGENGYAKTWLKDEEYEEGIRNLRKLLADKQEFYQIAKEIDTRLRK